MDQKDFLSIDALVRSLAVNRGRPVCLLLGAGASISSGMPSAQRCIWEWKQDIFVTNNPTLRETVGELSLPGTRQRIQRWLDQRGNHPVEGDSDEYSFFAEACYPTVQDRRAYFEPYVAKAKPHTGYRLLAQLSKAGLVRSVWTTNFDGLVARASAAADVICFEIGIDTQHRAELPQTRGALRAISLHGDYRYDKLKNTAAELQQQEAALREEFLHELRDYDLVVLGYSGRDASIMNVLRQAYERTTPSRLFWCGFGSDTPAPVEELIGAARAAGNDAFYIATDGFDDLITRLALRQLEGDLLTSAKAILGEVTATAVVPAAFAVPSHPATALVKSNAYLLTFPSHALKVPVDIPSGENRRHWLDDRLPPEKGALVAMDDGALAFADSKDIQDAFKGQLRSNPIAAAISADDLANDGRIRSLLRRALVQSLANDLGAMTDHSRRLWESSHYEERLHNGVKYRVHAAVSFRLESIAGKPHVALMPEVMVTMADGTLADRDTSKMIRNAVYGFQHNHVFDSNLKYWTNRIGNIDFPAKGGGVFRIGRAPIYAGLFQNGRSALPQEVQRHGRQQGLVVPDADLLFSSANGTVEVRDKNPLKGLVQNRPWDYQLTTSGLSVSVEVAAICPAQDAGKLQRFLNQLQERAEPNTNSERDYLQIFPGFSQAFGLPLNCPVRGQNGWIDLDDAVAGEGLAAAKQLANRICGALDVIRSTRPRAVATIFVPFWWAPYEKIDTDTEHFDLHHFLKAYAARHGQSTQFIREKTVIAQQHCRVRWWFSLALYAKAQRTPWRLDCLDDETAFVGIGYSLDSGAARGHHVLLGCSHLYNARGEGLQFRLGRIEDPIIRGRNPFMSVDDARRTGETIRQLFFDAKMRLPGRVVVHKRTAFTADEQRGLLQGLEGVPNIELIEVTIEESLRYLASKMSNGRPEIDTFPIPRGAVIVLDKTSALLWVHGATPNAQNPSRKYYQGKRRIPTPLLIRRFRGQSDITQVATEILGLSKMNWNTFDYYSRLPATLDSASAIAKVGAYLTGFGWAPYDYRLLI
ncbi:MAG: SIR2 family protein [Verrucomicrobiae bacterium]|nr:SIR2 family protein [Verrucomicrobiae bacterium]